MMNKVTEIIKKIESAIFLKNNQLDLTNYKNLQPMILLSQILQSTHSTVQHYKLCQKCVIKYLQIQNTQQNRHLFRRYMFVNQSKLNNKNKEMCKVILRMLQSEHIFELNYQPTQAQFVKYFDVVSYNITEDAIIVQIKNLKYRLSQIKRNFQQQYLLSGITA